MQVHIFDVNDSQTCLAVYDCPDASFYLQEAVHNFLVSHVSEEIGVSSYNVEFIDDVDARLTICYIDGSQYEYELVGRA